VLLFFFRSEKFFSPRPTEEQNAFAFVAQSEQKSTKTGEKDTGQSKREGRKREGDT